MKEPLKCFLASLLIGFVAPFVVILYEYILFNIYETLFLRLGYYKYFFPILGALSALLLSKMPIEKATTEGVIRSIYIGEKMPLSLASVILIGSLATIPFGLSAGTVAPLVVFGASFGRYISKACNVSYLRRNALILVGSASFLAAHISSPLAATLFVFEVIALGVFVERDALFVAMSSAISSALGTLLGSLIRLNRVYGKIYASVPPATLDSLAIVVLIGLISGLFSVFLVVVFETIYVKTPRNRGLIFVAASFSILSLYFFPYLIDPRIPELSGRDALIYAFFKPVFTATVIIFGGIGGTFLPTISSAIALGNFLNSLFGVSFLTPIVLAAVFGASSRCPMASILLALEMFDLSPKMTPRLVLGTTIAMIVNVLFLKDLHLYSLSIVIKHEKVRSFYIDPRVCMRVRGIVKRIKPIKRNDPVAKALHIMHEKGVHILPIVDDEGKAIGVVTLGDFKRAFILGTGVEPNDPIRKVSPKRRPITISPDASLEEALKIMDENRIDHLVVAEGDKIIGVISREDILNVARKTLIEDEILRTPPRPRPLRRTSLRGL